MIPPHRHRTTRTVSSRLSLPRFPHRFLESKPLQHNRLEQTSPASLLTQNCVHVARMMISAKMSFARTLDSAYRPQQGSHQNSFNFACHWQRTTSSTTFEFDTLSALIENKYLIAQRMGLEITSAVLSTTDAFRKSPRYVFALRPRNLSEGRNTAVTTATPVWVKPLSKTKTFPDTSVTFHRFIATQVATSPLEEIEELKAKN